MLLAVALSAMLLGAMLWFSADIANGRRRAVEAAKRSLAITTLFDRLETDLAFAVRFDPHYGAGVVGGPDRIALLSRAVLPGERTGAGSALGDLQRQVVRFDAASRRIQGARAPAADVTGGPLSTVDAEIFALRFRYYDGSQWLDEFDSDSDGALPVAVEIAAWLSPLPAWAQVGEPDLETTGDDRLTFDVSPVIDAEAAASATEGLQQQMPPPDRLRVIAVPDAAAAPEEGPAAGSARVGSTATRVGEAAL